MKIVCDNCTKHYSIGDDKVRGRVFKTKCRACGHMIFIRGDALEGGPPVAEPTPPEEEEEVAQAPEEPIASASHEDASLEHAAAHPDEPETSDEIFGGLTHPETPRKPFAGVVASAPPPEPTPAPAPSAAPPAPMAMPTDPSINIAESGFLAQRRDSSLLFSIDSLRAVSKNGTAPAPSPTAAAPLRSGFAHSRSDSTGLIDIRMMAAETLSATEKAKSAERSARPDPPVFLGATPAPLMIAPARATIPLWAWAAMGGGVLAVVMLATGLSMAVGRRLEPRPLAGASRPSTETPAAGDKTLLAGNAATAPPPAATEGTTNPATVAKAEKVTGTDPEKPAAPTTDKEPPAEPAAVEKPTTSSTKHGARTARAGHGKAAEASHKASRRADEDVNATSKKGARAAAPAAAAIPANAPEQLTRDDIKGGLAGAVPKARACFQKYHVKGTAMVALTIDGSGRVSKANVSGAMASSPSGDCVAKAIHQATFRKFRGSPMSIVYPVMLP